MRFCWFPLPPIPPLLPLRPFTSLPTLQIHCLSSPRRFSRGIQNPHHSHVRIERAQISAWLNLPAHNGSQIVQRSVFRCSNRRFSHRLLGRRLAEALPHVGRIHGNCVRFCSINFHIFAIEGPVPRRHQHGLRLRIAQNDGRV